MRKGRHSAKTQTFKREGLCHMLTTQPMVLPEAYQQLWERREISISLSDTSFLGKEVFSPLMGEKAWWP